MRTIIAATAALAILAGPALAGQKVAIDGRGYAGTADVEANGTGTFKAAPKVAGNGPTKVTGKFSGALPTSKTISYSFFGTYAGKNAAVKGHSTIANPGYTPPAPPPSKDCEGGKSYSQHSGKGEGRGSRGNHGKRS